MWSLRSASLHSPTENGPSFCALLRREADCTMDLSGSFIRFRVNLELLLSATRRIQIPFPVFFLFLLLSIYSFLFIHFLSKFLDTLSPAYFFSHSLSKTLSLYNSPILFSRYLFSIIILSRYTSFQYSMNSK